MNRSYKQACAVALFLDQLGTRWTLLIVRDLMIGPRRFKDLLDGLPGIGTNLLTERLQELQAMSVIEKEPSASGRNAAYRLTDTGRDLEPIILGMAHWGLSHISTESKGLLKRADLLVVALRALFNQGAAAQLNEAYQFELDDLAFYFSLTNGELSSGLGYVENPAFKFRSDETTFNHFANGNIELDDALADGSIKLQGSMAAFKRFQRVFSG